LLIRLATVPDQVTTYNLEAEAAACDCEEEGEGHAEGHREVGGPVVGSSVEEPRVDGHQEGEVPVDHRAMERLAREVAVLPISPADRHNFLLVVRRSFLLVVQVRRSFLLVVVRHNFLLVVHLAEAVRTNNSTAA
jgi:hypothetical protein